MVDDAPSSPRRAWLPWVAALVIAPVGWAYASLIGDPHLRIGMPVYPSSAPTWSGSVDALPSEIPEGSGCDWETVGSFLHAADVDLGRVVHPASLAFVVTSNEQYTLTLLRGGVPVNQLEPPRVPVPCQGTGMTRFEVPIPASTRAAGFDTVVLAGETVADHCVGAFEFIEPVEPVEPAPTEPPSEAPADDSGHEPLEDQPSEEDG